MLSKPKLVHQRNAFSTTHSIERQSNDVSIQQWLVAKVLLISLQMVLAACEHGVAIVGDGRVVAVSDSNRSCAPEDSPCRFHVTDDYAELYIAGPREGFVFAGWEHCMIPERATCGFTVPANAVREHWFKSYPSVTARFEPVEDTDRFDGVWLGEAMRNGVTAQLVCLSKPDHTLRCDRFAGDTRLFFGVELQLDGTRIISGAGLNFNEDFQRETVTVTGGSFAPLQNVNLSLMIADDPVTVTLNLHPPYLVAEPLLALAGDHTFFDSGNTLSIRRDGSFTMTRASDPGCTITGNLSIPEGLDTVSVWDMTLTRRNCQVLDGVFDGFAYSFQLGTETLFYMASQLRGSGISDANHFTAVYQTHSANVDHDDNARRGGDPGDGTVGGLIGTWDFCNNAEDGSSRRFTYVFQSNNTYEYSNTIFQRSECTGESLQDAHLHGGTYALGGDAGIGVTTSIDFHVEIWGPFRSELPASAQYWIYNTVQRVSEDQLFLGIDHAFEPENRETALNTKDVWIRR